MKHLLYIFTLATAIFAHAEERQVKTVKMAGPYATVPALMTTQKDVNENKIDSAEVEWKTPLDNSLWKESTKLLTVLNDSTGFILKGKGLYQLGFTVQNQKWQKIKINTHCNGRSQMYVDNNEMQGNDIALLPGRHMCMLKLQLKDDKADTISIAVDVKNDSTWTSQISAVEINPEGDRYFTLQDQMTGWRLNRMDISAGGRFAIQWRYLTRTDGTTEWQKDIIDLGTGAKYGAEGFLQWAASGDRYIAKKKDTEGHSVYVYRNPLNGTETPLVTLNDRNANISFAARDTKVIINRSEEAPREKNEHVHQILSPEDRIGGWRSRNNVAIMDVKTREVRQLTAGARNVWASVSDDGSQVLLSMHYDNVSKRPFQFSDAYLMTLSTDKVDTLFKEEGFVGEMQFSPDGKKLLVLGGPEAFSGIGNVCDTTLVPNTYDGQLFTYDLATHKVTPLTRTLNPSVTSYRWSRYDGTIYAMCEDKDMKGIYALSAANLKAGNYTWKRLPLKEDYTYHNWDIAESKPLLVYSGEGATTSDRAWLMDLKSGKQTLLTDLNPERTAGIKMGRCVDWNFTDSRGQEITGCYYLPPFFDETKQYPMLVYYYGGCSPVGRYLDSPYCYEAWAANGYIVYVLQPSGCTGFGQQFSALHSNAWGDYAANDIIEGTTKFCAEHPWVNAKKVGCLGASYGGFMTQYLQTRTDIFAAAVSHAGISNVTSYWGEGYWGYSYNATAAPNSYPWTRPELFTKHSPLFNADKIHTPLLFMHGGADTNVPIGESIQMFNALKILGRETAFVIVDGENHYIGDHFKRQQWHNAIMAWFQRWLQDDASWWNDLYPEKNL